MYNQFFLNSHCNYFTTKCIFSEMTVFEMIKWCWIGEKYTREAELCNVVYVKWLMQVYKPLKWVCVTNKWLLYWYTGLDRYILFCQCLPFNTQNIFCICISVSSISNGGPKHGILGGPQTSNCTPLWLAKNSHWWLNQINIGWAICRIRVGVLLKFVCADIHNLGNLSKTSNCTPRRLV